jgi:pimeloyl-ACP methyl ester carboxylesterase
VQGTGPWLTLVHGFPTCSWDWQKIATPLARRHRLLLIELLGYGDSDKPAHHRYSCIEHADLIEACWRHLGIEETSMLTHDVGSTITQELLARQKEGLCCKNGGDMVSSASIREKSRSFPHEPPESLQMASF